MVLARNVSLFFGRGHQKTAVSISGPQLAYGSCQECGLFFFGTVGGRESEEVLVILEVLHERGSISEELMEPAPVFLLCNCTVQYCTVQYCIQYCTVQYGEDIRTAVSIWFLPGMWAFFLAGGRESGEVLVL